MIPKIIHYCWFGRGKMPHLALKCIDSWKVHLPDYKLLQWNEDNFDINSKLYVKQAYENKKYAFVSDYVRLYALYCEGGIYMDTDVEILSSLDGFLLHPAFSGFEGIKNVPTGLMAAQKGSKWIKELLRHYDKRSFILDDGSFDMTTNTETITDYMVKKGLKLNDQYQEIRDLVAIYPHDYFCPKDHTTGVVKISPRTVCIHHFSMSWINPRERQLSNMKKALMKMIGINTVNKLIEILNLRQIRQKLLK